MLGALLRWLSPRQPSPASGATGTGAPYGAIIRKAERCILALAQRHCPKATVFSFGAVDIDPQHLAIWITTPSDKERDRLLSSKAFNAAAREVLATAGYPAEAIPRVGLAFESQETVDRIHGGNWWYAVK